MNTNELQQLAWDAEDAGREVYIYRHPIHYDLITKVEIDGEQVDNEFLGDEISDSSPEALWRE